ncbi:MAG TPA: hypothetical protein DDW76_08295 [Cyanobacteria bacterium UBA11369]|nr:hypothetical protein [Cyanobacteria bacterium UBA11371]HBE32239.1 hypothetical protein [Cyanobacteria bacterium UBA11368]HBE48782.1 hypothetical protein [Cyanobacteria bacterium UBA11369]
MTQDQPQQPEPQQQIPPTTPAPTPTPKAPVSQSGKAVQTVVQTLGETWKTVQPVLKEGTVKTLRGTIWVLQGAVNQLEGQQRAPIQLPVDTLPSAATLPPEMPVSIPGDATPPVTTKPAVPAKPASQLSNALAIARTVIITLWQWWKAAIAKLRSLLPESVKQKLPNNDILSGAIAAILLVFFWLNSSSSPPAVAKVPPEISTPAAEIEVSPEVTPTPEVTPLPEIKVSPEVTSTGEINVSVEVTPPAEVKVTQEAKPPVVETPPELTAPKPSKPVAIVPPPPPVLTPEQKLLAEIQNKIAEITKESADGLIQSVQANFKAGQLTVKISDDWYNFDVAKQDKLAADMWNRAQELDFSKVEITDTSGTLIARSAIVGSNIIVLKRQM